MRKMYNLIWYKKGYMDAKKKYGSNWFLIKDKLPENKRIVLLKDNEGNYMIGRFSIKDGLSGFECGDYFRWWNHISNFVEWAALP